MILNKRKKNREAEIPTSSMADIAFLLLTFFLVSTSLDLDKGLGLTLPALGDTFEIHRTNIVTLHINEWGEVFFDDELGQGQEISVNAIKGMVREKLIRNPNVVISIHASRDTQYQNFMDVLDQVKMAEVSRISIAEPEA
jgi:biopolymer transport protein ExbD